MVIFAKETAQWQTQTVYRNVDERIGYAIDLNVAKIELCRFLNCSAAVQKKRKESTTEKGTPYIYQYMPSRKLKQVLKFPTTSR